MAITEKEKALDVVRQMVADGQVSQEVAEKYFPELKESEDERVLKIIKETLKSYNSGIIFGSLSARDYADCLAWLEKRGEKGAKGNEMEIPIPEPPLTIKHAKEVMGIKQDDAWSEEDDRMYNRIVSFIPQHLTAESYTACITWLKSLRPQNKWKPSDEQMKILNEVLNFAANHESPHWNDYIFGTLNNLIRQLKRLREE